MYLKVTVAADSKKEKVEFIKEGQYKISVKEPAENNLANKRVLEIIKSLPEAEDKVVRLVSGHQKPAKKFEISEVL
jgi:uncharacterized protein YggU (UPF0235/DUF167 family)